MEGLDMMRYLGVQAGSEERLEASPSGRNITKDSNLLQ
jgi:hypothetical protein